MTTSQGRRSRSTAVALRYAWILAALVGHAASSLAEPAANPPAHSPSADSTATLRVETNPSGLEVLVDGVSVGRSPVGPLQLPAKTVRVHVVAPDPRLFNSARDAAEVILHAGAGTSLYFDLRPLLVLRSEPEPAAITLVGRVSGPDSLLGETPLQIPPGLLEGASVRFQKEGFADTTIAGTTIAVTGSASEPVPLRPSGATSSHGKPQRGKHSFYERRWFHWTLVGVGAALSGAAVVFHHEGDTWYDRYLASSDVRKIPDLYDQAVHYDHLAALSFGVGQAALIGGLALILTGQSR